LLFVMYYWLLFVLFVFLSCIGYFSFFTQSSR
jgi:hypothetical protein